MEWMMHRTVERQAIRMQKMMERLDVDAVQFVRLRHGDVYAKARSTCLFCQDGDRCLKWLDNQGMDGSPDFCPILELLKACRKIQPGKRNVA